MAMVDVDDSSLSTGGLTAQVDWLGLRVGGHLALSLHQSREWVDGSWVMGQMGHENRMGHMGH